MIELLGAESELIVMCVEVLDVLHPCCLLPWKIQSNPGKPSYLSSKWYVPPNQVFVGVPDVALLLVSTLSHPKIWCLWLLQRLNVITSNSASYRALSFKPPERGKQNLVRAKYVAWIAALKMEEV